MANISFFSLYREFERYGVCKKCNDKHPYGIVKTLHMVISKTDYKRIDFKILPIPCLAFYTIRISYTCEKCGNQTMRYKRGACKITNLINEVEKFRR